MDAGGSRAPARAPFVTFEDETGLLESLVPRGVRVDNPGPCLAEGTVRDARLRVSALRPFYERRSALT